MASKRSVLDYPVAGRRVFVRVDFNVPLVDGAISDDTRIRAALPTLRYLLEQGCSLVLATHLGRPKGQVVEELRLASVAFRLAELLGRPVLMAPSCRGGEVEQAADSLRPGDVLLLENLRFHPEETANDEAFARDLAVLAEVFVNDAFGTAHRAHASTAGIAAFLPAVSGLLMAAELKALGGVLDDPKRPFVVVLGGLKVSDKITLIESMLSRADAILIGGAMANAFFKAKGYEIGASKGNGDQVQVAAAVLEKAAGSDCRLLLPVDVVCAPDPDATATKTVAVDAIGTDDMALDIGAATSEIYGRELAQAGTIYWNGPMGFFEKAPFAAGTHAVGEAIAASPAITVAGGGDTVSAVKAFGLGERLTHVSTGGGASMEFLEGRTLPGVAALLDAPANGRRPLIAGNWKMYKTRAAAREFFAAFAPAVADVAERDIVICPPFVTLETALAAVAGTTIGIGAQTMAAVDEGAFTGEVSPAMLSELGVPWVILGHSERRALFNETDDALAAKLRAALDAGLRPILCVGESLAERQEKQTEAKIRGQLSADLAAIDEAELAAVTIAYEPIWAIGTGVTATSEQAQATIAFIRAHLRRRAPAAAAEVRILYGGSVNAGNIADLMAQPDIDGVLVGGASLDPASFATIVRYDEAH